MSEPIPEPGEQGAEPELTGPEWWATLEPAALQDEIEHNRRGERWLVLVGIIAVACTAIALVIHRLTT